MTDNKAPFFPFHRAFSRKFTDKIYLRNLAVFLLILGSWLWVDAYRGVVHDSLFYVAQALSYLNPNLAEHDIFLRYGTQSHFNLFDDVLALAIGYFGLNSAVIGLLLFGQTLWIVALLLLHRSLIAGHALLFTLIFILTLSPFYASHEIFSYGEPFLTPRLYAEAFVLLAIWLAVLERQILAMGLIAATAVIHPLVAITGAIFLGFYWLMTGIQRWQLLIAGCASLATVFLAVAGIAPFDGLLQVMEPKWYTSSVERSPWIAISQWKPSAYGNLLFDLSLLYAAVQLHPPGKLRPLLQASLLAGIGGVVFTWLFADLLHVRLILQLQLWRVLWITHLFSYLAVAYLIFSPIRQHTAGKAFLLALLGAWLAPAPYNGIIAVTMVLLYSKGAFTRLETYPYWLRRGFLLPILVLALSWLVVQLSAIARLWQLMNGYQQYDLVHLLARLLAVIFPLLLWLLLSSQTGRERGLALVMAAALFVTGLNNWDMRDSWQRQVEHGEVNAMSLFGVALPADALIYWKDGLRDVWLALQRPSYWSMHQGAAGLFSRELSEIFLLRLEELKVLGETTHDYDQRKQLRREVADQNIFTPTALQEACRDISNLDYIILEESFPKLMLSSFKHPERGEYFLYDCNQLREDE